MIKSIYETLNHNLNSDLVSFHMPGHKNGRIYKDLGYDEYINKFMFLDTTEIIGTDDLHNPNGIIEKSQIESMKIIDKDLCDYKLRYVVNGSTCGIMSSILSVCKPGEKIILNRACHQSAYNACILGSIEPVFVDEIVDRENGVFLGSTEEGYYRLIDDNLDARAIFITRPTYYGMCFDIENIVNYAHERGMYVIVDEAHGAHFFLSEKLPNSSIKYNADFVIQSIHKTLPSMTQSSVLLLRDIDENKKVNDRLFSILSMLESSSPSYVMMMNLELAFDICDKYGRVLMESLLINIEKFKETVDVYNIFNTSDPTKIFINTIKLGKTGTEFSETLRYKYNIQVELSNHHGVLMLCSIGNNKSDFDLMANALLEIYDELSDTNAEISDFPVLTSIKSIRVISTKDSFYMDSEYVRIDESIGRVSASSIVPYPPGVCLLSPGEIITEELVEYINKGFIEGMQINGIKFDDGVMINVVKTNNL